MKIVLNQSDVKEMVALYLEANTKFEVDELDIQFEDNQLIVLMDEAPEEETEEPTQPKQRRKRGPNKTKVEPVVEEEPVIKLPEELVLDPIDEAISEEEDVPMIPEAEEEPTIQFDEPLFDTSKPLFG